MNFNDFLFILALCLAKLKCHQHLLMSTDVYGVSSRRASRVPNWRSALAISISRAYRRASMVKHTSTKLIEAKDQKSTRATEKKEDCRRLKKMRLNLWCGKQSVYLRPRNYTERQASGYSGVGGVRSQEKLNSAQRQVLNSFRREALAATVVFVPEPFWSMQSLRWWIVC